MTQEAAIHGACPFCGETKELEEELLRSFDRPRTRVIVCRNCGAKGPEDLKPWRSWNVRA